MPELFQRSLKSSRRDPVPFFPVETCRVSPDFISIQIVRAIDASVPRCMQPIVLRHVTALISAPSLFSFYMFKNIESVLRATNRPRANNWNCLEQTDEKSQGDLSRGGMSVTLVFAGCRKASGSFHSRRVHCPPRERFAFCKRTKQSPDGEKFAKGTKPASAPSLMETQYPASR